MAGNWSIDVRKYAPDASGSVIDAIIRYCGVSLQRPDSALVAFSDPAELSLVRENYLKKKLGLTDPDTELDAGIAAVGDRMKADRTKNRVTVYYLLAERFRKLSVFGGVDAIERAAPAAFAAGAAGVAAAATVADTPRPSPTPERPVVTPAAFAGRTAAAAPAQASWMRWLPWLLVAALVLLLAWWLFARRPATPTPVAAEPPAATAPAIATAPAVAGAPAAASGVTIAGLPTSVFFDTDSAAIEADGGQAIRAAADAIRQSGSRIAITGYTDRTGDLAKNQELARNRAVAVRDALVAAGVPDASIEMRPPVMVEVGGAGGSDADARRVEISTL